MKSYDTWLIEEQTQLMAEWLIKPDDLPFDTFCTWRYEKYKAQEGELCIEKSQLLGFLCIFIPLFVFSNTLAQKIIVCLGILSSMLFFWLNTKAITNTNSTLFKVNNE